MKLPTISFPLAGAMTAHPLNTKHLLAYRAQRFGVPCALFFSVSMLGAAAALLQALAAIELSALPRWVSFGATLALGGLVVPVCLTFHRLCALWCHAQRSAGLPVLQGAVQRLRDTLVLLDAASWGVALACLLGAWALSSPPLATLCAVLVLVSVLNLCVLHGVNHVLALLHAPPSNGVHK